MNGVMSNPRVLLLLLIHRPAGPDIAFGQNKILLAPALDQTAAVQPQHVLQLSQLHHQCIAKTLVIISIPASHLY